MEEANIMQMVYPFLLPMVQEIGFPDIEAFNFWVEDQNYKNEIKSITNELGMMVDFLRGKELEEGSRLNYFICDAIEIARDFDINAESYILGKIHKDLKITKNRMLQFEDHPPIRSSENIGEGDDGDVDVVGLDEDVELLLRKDISANAPFSWTLLITGMSGVGKTTLARKLYNHKDIVDRFDRRAWVCVSNLSNKEVLMKLIQQVVDSDKRKRDSLLEKMERADNHDLQRMLRQNLQGKHYFIVLDDLPREMSLKSILKALPHKDEEKYTLVLISCSKNTDLIWDNTSSFHYEMKTLDPHKSWQLFLETLFCGASEEYTFPKHLEKWGREMLMKNCDGLPLAIKEVGKQLAEKRLSGCEWEDLFESIDLDSTLELMEPTYHKLSPEMKSCFLHLAFFKDNTNIRLEKLVYIMVATGTASNDMAAWSCQYHLEIDSIIESKYKSESGLSRPLCMNGVLHMLSIKKANEEFGFEILSNDRKVRHSQIPLHRVIRGSREKFDYSKDQDKHLVSLLFHGGGRFDFSPSYWESLQELRVLDFEDFGLKVLPESIGSLVELRYLGLRNNYIQELPDSLGLLKKLEVLDIVQNFMVEVPDIIWEMSSLLILYMSDIICRKPLKIDALQNLKTLTYVSVDSWTYELSGLQMMTFLYKLGVENFVEGNSGVSKLFASLAELPKLEHLMLRGSRLRSMPCLDQLGILHNVNRLKLDGILTMLPNANDFPPNMHTLVLVNSCLDEDPMPVLEKLPKLSNLKLQNAYTGQQMVILHGGFPELRYLCIEELWNLRIVEVGKSALPFLRTLEIKNCPHLETLPKDIGSSLEELKMVTTKRIATELRKSGSIPKIERVDINAEARAYGSSM